MAGLSTIPTRKERLCTFPEVDTLAMKQSQDLWDLAHAQNLFSVGPTEGKVLILRSKYLKLMVS